MRSGDHRQPLYGAGWTRKQNHGTGNIGESDICTRKRAGHRYDPLMRWPRVGYGDLCDHDGTNGNQRQSHRQIGLWPDCSHCTDEYGRRRKGRHPDFRATSPPKGLPASGAENPQCLADSGLCEAPQSAARTQASQALERASQTDALTCASLTYTLPLVAFWMISFRSNCMFR